MLFSTIVTFQLLLIFRKNIQSLFVLWLRKVRKGVSKSVAKTLENIKDGELQSVRYYYKALHLRHFDCLWQKWTLKQSKSLSWIKQFSYVFLFHIFLRKNVGLTSLCWEWNFTPSSRDRSHPTITCEIKFCPDKAGQFSTWHLIRFVCNFFEFVFVIMSVYEIESP